MWHNTWTVYDGHPIYEGKSEDRVTTDRQEAIAQYLNSQDPNYRFTVEQSDSEFFAEVTWDHGPPVPLPMKSAMLPYKLHPQLRSPVQAQQCRGVRFIPSTKKAAPINAKDLHKQQQRSQEDLKASLTKGENRIVPESVRFNHSTRKTCPVTKAQHKVQQVPLGSPKKEDDKGVPEANGRYSRAGSDSDVSMVDEPSSKGLRRSTRIKRPVHRD
ncbi:hypothetical protein BGZ91_005897 [Linnemannia elongata]|nr:hypothetical protein BGZ91_005897 [Linnemannia elongata]